MSTCAWCGYEKDTPNHEIGCGITAPLARHVMVEKKSGEYKFPGVIVAVFQNMAGVTRVVVESKADPGMLHIFSPGQLKPVASEMLCGKCRHPWKNHERPDPYDVGMGRTEVGLVCTAYVGMGDWCGCDERKLSGS